MNSNMSEITFGALGGDVAAPVIDAESGKQVAPEAAPAPAQPKEETGMIYRSSLPSIRDVILPHINIVHPLSKTAALFPVGSITFAENTLLYSPPNINIATGNVLRAPMPPAIITVLDFKPERFVEKVSDGIGNIVNSAAAVVAAGGTLDWSEWQLKQASGMKLYQVLAEAMVAIERPEHIADDDSVFVYKVNDKKYTLAIWSMKGSVYTEAAKKGFFLWRLTGCLVPGYPTFSFSLTTKLKAFKTGNSSWVPIVSPRTKSTPEFLAFAAGVLGQA